MVERGYKLTIRVASKGTVDAWRRVASEMGYVAETGGQVGQGNISAFLGAIVAGEVDMGKVGRLFREGRCRAPGAQTD